MNVQRTILTTAALLTTIGLSTMSEVVAPHRANAENLQHIRQLLSTKQCQQCQLHDAGLVMADLTGANLSGADLTRANLSQANLTGADLTGANLTGASLYGANLAGANLSGANLSSTDLRTAFLAGAKLFGVSLSNAYVQGAIGIPDYAGTPEDFYAWGVVEAQRGNYEAAIGRFNQVLTIKPDFAPALLARGIAFYKLGNEAAATYDAQQADTLFISQGNAGGSQTAQNFIAGMETARKLAARGTSGGGGNFGQFLGSVGSLLLRFLL